MEPRMIFCLTRARVESQNHWFTYDEKMQVHCTMYNCTSSWVAVMSWSWILFLRSTYFLTGGECGSSSFQPCNPVWRLRWRCRGHVKVINLLLKLSFLHFCLQTFRCCNSLCWNGRQWDPALPHGPQRHIPPVWRKGNWLRQRGSSTEFARGSNFWELYFLNSHLSNH